MMDVEMRQRIQMMMMMVCSIQMMIAP